MSCAKFQGVLGMLRNEVFCILSFCTVDATSKCCAIVAAAGEIVEAALAWMRCLVGHRKSLSRIQESFLISLYFLSTKGSVVPGRYFTGVPSGKTSVKSTSEIEVKCQDLKRNYATLNEIADLSCIEVYFRSISNQDKDFFKTRTAIKQGHYLSL